MTVKLLNPTLKTSLESYDPFIVAHLVKFERPSISTAPRGVVDISATSFSYLTDAQHDLLFNDDSVDNGGTPLGPQTYRANKVQKLGTVNENIQAKASNMSLVIDSSSLGTSVTSILTFTGSEITGDVDLSSEGFQEGDKVLLKKSNGLNNHNKHVRIESFKNGGKTIVYTAIDTIQTSATPREYTISQASEEIVSILADKYSDSYTGYINREVLIYRAHINPETRAIIGKPYLYFKGITSGVALDERLDASKVTWNLSSHWGDFLRVSGRLTDDSTHRSLKLDGTPDLDSVVRPEYAGDLGFMHSNTAINQIASYMIDEDYLAVQPTSGHFNFQSTETVTRTRQVEKNVNLAFNPQAKMLPVVYGIRKLDSFPVFVDTHKDTSTEVYKLDAICEGKIAGILDIHIDGIPTLCLDKSDFNTRNPSGSGYKEDEVEIECVGRADRGDTLAQYNAAETGDLASQPPGQWGYACTGSDGVTLYQPTADEALVIPVGGDQFLSTTFENSATGAVNGQAQDATGLLHEGTHTITKPTPVDLTFHQGLENQSANNTLVSLAKRRNFKVQNDYFDETRGEYWSPSHRLLDTAYVLGRYQVGEGATTIPKLEYVVRGRDPECYNYDGSYRESTTVQSSAISNFPLGSTVTLHETSGDDQIGSAVTIVDKWASFDSDGQRDYRVRFSTLPTLVDSDDNPITEFYMKNSSNNKWYMETWDNEKESGSVHSILRSSTFTMDDQSSQYGLKATFTSIDSNFETALEDDLALVGVDTSSTPTGLLASSWVYASYSNNVLDNLTSFGIDPGIEQIYVKNAIKLDRTLGAAFDNFCVGARITVKSSGYEQTRIITKYDGATGIAFVNSPWDYKHIPSGSDTYTIGSLGDRRVTLNPAMQLLDYMTNERYGKGLSVEKDINLEDWKKASRECDQRSEVTVIFGSGSSFTEGDEWQYPSSSSPLQWRGTVKEVQTLSGKVQVTFKDVIGKLASKWNSYRTYASNEPYWYNGNLYMGSGSSVPNAPTGSGALSSFTLYKTGNNSTTKSVDISSSAANGNPIVKKHSSITGNFTASGYSLYDCDDVKYWKYVGWDDTSQRNVTRHQMNQVIDTTLPVFENINSMLVQFNGMLNYSAGKYSLHVKSKKGFVDNVEKISNEDIIGTIKLSDSGVKGSKNYVTSSILDPQNKFASRSVSFFNSKYLKEDKGIQKKSTFNLPGITNYYNARFNIKQRLDESRFGLTIQFTMAPKGLLLNAGSIVEITYPRFGYVSKDFRITNLNLKKDGTVDVTAVEHNDDAYEVSQEGGASIGFGVVETPESSQAPLSLPIISRPTSLTCTQNKQGEILLSWSNSGTFSSATHVTEIYSSTVNDFENTTDPVSLIGTSSTNTFSDLVTEGQGNKTRYYWIRYQVRTGTLNRNGTDFRNVPSNYEPAAPESGTHVGVEGVGQASFAVRSVKLSAGVTSAFVYNNAGDGIQFGNATSTTMSTTTANVAGTESFKWYKDGVEIAGETDSTFDYTAPSNVTDMPEIIKVELTDTLADGTTLTAEDEFTFIGLRTVEDAYTVIPSTPNYNFQATEFGTIDGPGSFSTTFTVKKGGTAYAYDGTPTYDDNSYRYGTITNITPQGAVVINALNNIDSTTGAISISTSAGSFLAGTSVTQCSFDVPILDNADGSTIATSRIVLSKSLDGINARTVKLTAPEQVITYDSTGATPDPSAVFQITAEPFNTTGTPKYEFFLNGSSAQASSTTATFNYTPPASYSTLPQIITVKLREGSSQDVLATDTFTVFGVKDATDAVDQKTVFIFAKNDSDAAVGFSTVAPYSVGSPATAANQSFSDPLQGLETGWSTSQPALDNNNDVIYMSQRTFTSDGSSPQQAAWEAPVVAARRIDGTSFTVVGSVPNAATSNVRFRFEAAAYPNTEPSYNTPNVLIGSPTEQSYSVTIPSETVGSNTFTSLLMYVSPRDVPVNLGSFVLNASSDTASTLEPNFSQGFGGATISSANGSGATYEHPTGTGTEDWGGFVNTESTLIDDAISFSSDGSITFNASIPNYTTQAQTILNASFNTQGSPASVGDAVIAQDTGNLWIWDGTSWDDVGQIKGDHGVDGINEKRVYLFAKNPTLDGNGVPPAITADAGQQTYTDPTDGVNSPWTTTQESLTADEDIIYMVERLFTSSGTGTETSWSAPIVISQRVDGVSPDALTITSTTKTGDVTTITFSDDTTVDVSDGTDGTDAGVKVIYAEDASGTNASFTQGTKEFVNYYEWTGSAPATVPTGLTYTKFIGEDGDNEGVLPIYAEDASGTNASFDMGSREFVNFYEWTSSAPGTVPAGLTYVKFVGEDGAAGADPILMAYDNSSHVVPVSTSGNETWTGSGGKLFVYEGTTSLDLLSNSQTTNFPSANDVGKFNIDITNVSGDTLTEPDALSYILSGGTELSDFSGNLTQATKYKITAYIRAAGGSTYTRSVDVSLVPADQGATGSDGLRTVTGYLYYEDTTGSAPTAPGGNTYHFNGDNIGLVTGTGINNSGTTNCWKNTPNTMQSSSTNTYYTMSYHGIEAAAGQTTATVTYGTVRIHTSFSGVVTFSSGSFSQDGTAISDIDGTNVQLNSTALSETNTLNSNTTAADVGLDQVTNDAQVKADLTNAPDSIKNDQISINTDGTLTGAGSGQVTAEGIGADNLKLLSSGGKTRKITGNKVAIEGGGTQSNWDTQVYSADGYDAAQASWVVDNSNDYYAMIGINATPNTDISPTNTAEDYHHIDFAWYMRNQKLFAHKDGQNQSGDVEGAGEGTYAAGDKLSVTYDGVNAKYYKNGSLLRTIAATKTGPFHFDSSWYLRNKSISQVQFGPITNAKDVLESDHTGPINGVAADDVTSGAAEGAQVQAQQSLLPRADDSEWSLGAVGSGFARGIWARNGAGGDENTIVLEAGPFGTNTKVWKSISTDGSSNDGGFHNNGSAVRFPIEDDVTYRFSVFIKQSDFDGSIYFGAYNYDHVNLTDGNPTNIQMFEYNGASGTSNKYWYGNSSPSTDLPTLNEWYLWVGFINPSDTSINSNKGGLYKVSTGERVLADNDIRFNANATTFAIRTYLFYSSTGSGTTVRWAHPRVDRMDRSSPTIMQILGSENAVLNKEISLNTDGTLNNAGGGAVTAEGLGAESLELLSTNSVKPVTIKGNKISADYEIIGSNLISNGEFTDGAGGWTFGSDFVWDNSGVVKRVAGTSNSQIKQNIDIVSGKYYRIRYDVVHTSGTTTSNVYSNWSGSGNSSHGTSIAGSGSQDIVIQAGHTATILFQLYGIDTWRGYFDNIRVEEVADITDSWDTHVFSKDGYPAASATFVADQNNVYAMAGLNSDPTSATSYQSLDYAWFLKDGGVLGIYESNTAVNITNNSYTAGDKFTVTYDGINVKYFKNAVLERTVEVALSTNLHFDSSFKRPNRSISKVGFAPITDVQSIPKANVGLDQVTNDAQVKADGTNAPNSIKNNQISLNADGTMTGAGGGQVTAEGIGADTLTILTAANSGSNSKTITVEGNTIKASGGIAGWNTHAYSKEGYEACAVMYQVDSGSGSYFVGLNTDPENNTSYDTIDYAIYNANGNIEIRKNGSTRYGPTGPTAGNAVHNWGSYSAGDTFGVTYDGVNVKFYHNGGLITSIEDTTITSLLHMDTSFYTVNRQISKVSFKPLTSIRTVPKESVGLENVNNPSTATTPIGTVDVSPNIGGVGQSQIDGSVIKAGSTVVAGQGTNKAGITGTAADGSIGTAENSAESDIRIFSGSTFANRASAPFRVQQNGAFRAEFGHIGGFTIGSDSLVSETASQPLLTIGSDLAANPAQQISLSSRAADEFLLYAGVEVPSGGVGIKKSDNPPFGVDSNGKVFMREFELKDANNNVVLDSDNLLGSAINAQITNLLKAGSDQVPFSDDSPGTGFKFILTKTQNIQIDYKVYAGNLRVFGLDKNDGSGNGYTIQNALDSICPKIVVKLERSTNGSTWSTMQTKTFTAQPQAGSQPSLGANEYWVDAEEYMARFHGLAFRAEMRRGYGAIDDNGNISGSLQLANQPAGTYYWRINTNTGSGTKGIEYFARNYNPSTASWYVDSQVFDMGFGLPDVPRTQAPGITNPRNFTIGSYSGSGTPGGSYSIDENLSPPTVKEGKTFDDFVPLTGGTVTGSINFNGGATVSGELAVNYIKPKGGQKLVIGAGESVDAINNSSVGPSIANTEHLYLMGEDGIKIISHPSNWSDGSNMYTSAAWANRNEAIICNTAGNSTLPGNLLVEGALIFQDGSYQYSGGPEAVPHWYAFAVNSNNRQTPAQMWAENKLMEYRRYDPDRFWMGTNEQQFGNSNSQMYSMYVRNHSTSNRTKTWRIFNRDDDIFIYVNGVLAGSETYDIHASEATPETISITIPGKDSASDLWKVSRVDIVKNDHGNGDWDFEMYCQGMWLDKHWQSPRISFQPFNYEFDYDDENYNNVPANKNSSNY